jgi:hypothetical protein
MQPIEFLLEARDSRNDRTCLVKVDMNDWLSYSDWRWRVSKDGYAYRLMRIRLEDGTRKQVEARLHRLIAGLKRYDGLEVDHINGDRLDNRRSNLRVVTNAENKQNVRVRKDSISGLRGVCWRSDRGKWKAEARLNGKRYRLGYFDSKECAAAVVSEWRIQHMPFTVETR